jgi:diguanylate cyclase (GGDEF)-like protein/PAS domain S-box-containing protein
MTEKDRDSAPSGSEADFESSAFEPFARLAWELTGLPLAGICADWDGRAWRLVAVAGADPARASALMRAIHPATAQPRDAAVPPVFLTCPMSCVPGDAPAFLVAAGDQEPPAGRIQAQAALGRVALAAATAICLRAGGNLFQSAFAQAASGITIADAREPDMPLIHANDRFLEMTGYTRDAVIGQNCRFLQGPAREQAGRHEIRRAIKEGRTTHVELTNYRADGTLFVNDFTLAPIGDREGRVTHFIGVQQDMTARRRLEQRLEEDRRQLHQIVSALPSGILIANDAGAIRFANSAAEALIGRSADHLIGMPIDVPSGEGQAVELELETPEGQQRVAELNPVRVTWEEENAWLLMLNDVTDRKREEARITKMAYTDSLTGLANRLHLRERLDRAVMQARQPPRRRVGLIMLDLDGFKQINDNLGHAAGDEALRTIADRLQQQMRGDDLVARLGGDEFAIFLPDLRDREAAEAVARRVIAAFAEPIEVEGHTAQVAASLGVSFFPDDGEDAAEMLERADAAMYASKEQAESTYRFSPSERTADET